MLYCSHPEFALPLRAPVRPSVAIRGYDLSTAPLTSTSQISQFTLPYTPYLTYWQSVCAIKRIELN